MCYCTHIMHFMGKAIRTRSFLDENGNERKNNNNNNEFNWTLKTIPLEDKRTTITIFYIFIIWNKWSLYPANRLLCHLTEAEEEEKNIHIFWLLTVFIRSFGCRRFDFNIFLRFTFQNILLPIHKGTIFICDAQILHLYKYLGEMTRNESFHSYAGWLAGSGSDGWLADCIIKYFMLHLSCQTSNRCSFIQLMHSPLQIEWANRNHPSVRRIFDSNLCSLRFIYTQNVET